MNQSVHLAALLLRMTLGALALALGFLTLAALASPPFAAALVAQGMPLPLGWPAMLAEFGSVLVFLGLHAPRPRRPAGRTSAGLVSECQT